MVNFSCFSEIIYSALFFDIICDIRTHFVYKAKAKKSCYIKQQFTVLKVRAS